MGKRRLSSFRMDHVVGPQCDLLRLLGVAVVDSLLVDGDGLVVAGRMSNGALVVGADGYLGRATFTGDNDRSMDLEADGGFDVLHSLQARVSVKLN
jgi:hypothetical protein